MPLHPRPAGHVPFLLALPLWIVQAMVGYVVFFGQCLVLIVRVLTKLIELLRKR